MAELQNQSNSIQIRKMAKKINVLSLKVQEDISEGRLQLGKTIDFDTSLLNRKNRMSLQKLYRPSLPKSEHSSEDKLRVNHFRSQLK